MTAESEAMAAWKAGDRAGAKAALYRQSTDAAPADAAAARLRLGYMNVAEKNDAEARRLWEATADIPAGVNDAAKSEAAIRLGYFDLRDKSYDLARARFQRILSGEYVVSATQAVDVSPRLGGMEQNLGNHQEAVPYYEAVAANESKPAARAEAKTLLAGLWIELGKGEGNRAISPGERPSAFDHARAICQEVLTAGPDEETSNTFPDDHRMVAELMYFETFYFQGDYDTSFQLGAQFLDHWGSDPEKYQKRNMKIYLNTARTFTALNAYLSGRFADSVALSEALVANTPPVAERFASLDPLMYGTVCGSLSREALGQTTEAAALESAGRAYNAQHYDLLRPALQARRGEFVALRGETPKGAKKLASLP